MPPVSLQRHRYTERDHAQVFGFEINYIYSTSVLSNFWSAYSFCPSSPTPVPSSIVAIPEVQPQYTIVPRHAPDFPEYLDHLLHVFLRSLLQTDLPPYLIIP
jgi:hypothetical protein